MLKVYWELVLFFSVFLISCLSSPVSPDEKNVFREARELLMLAEYQKNLGRLELGVESLYQAIEKSPFDQDIQQRLHLFLVLLGRYPEALHRVSLSEKYFKKTHGDILQAQRVEIFFWQNRYDEAQELLYFIDDAQYPRHEREFLAAYYYAAYIALHHQKNQDLARDRLRPLLVAFRWNDRIDDDSIDEGKFTWPLPRLEVPSHREILALASQINLL